MATLDELRKALADAEATRETAIAALNGITAWRAACHHSCTGPEADAAKAIQAAWREARYALEDAEDAENA